MLVHVYMIIKPKILKCAPWYKRSVYLYNHILIDSQLNVILTHTHLAYTQEQSGKKGPSNQISLTAWDLFSKTLYRFKHGKRQEPGQN